MKNMKVSICEFIIIVTFFGIFGAETNCKSKQLYNLSVKDCCEMPKIHWDAFKNKCNFNELRFQRQPSLCSLDCAFNASDSITNGTINLINLRSMLTTLLDNYTEFIDAYVLGFEKCVPLVKNMIKLKKNNSKIQQTQKISKCSILPAFYSTCAYKHVFLNCPPTAWNATSECEDVKKQLKECKKEFGGGKRKQFDK